MAEYIEDPEIVKELEEIFDEFAQELVDHIEVSTDPREYPSDIEAALGQTKPGETLFIFESEDGECCSCWREKWLIPAKSEEGALEHVRSLVKKIKGEEK